MSGNRRISTFNGALLAAYFIPAWTIAAFTIIISPIHGLYERPNISLALFVSDHLQLSGMATVRVAWLLALGRMTVVAFLAVFLVFITRASTRRSGGCDADWIRELARQQGAWAKHSTETKSQRPDLLQPLSVSRAQPDRTVLQQDQTMSACRDPIRQTRSQMFGVRQTRVNPDLATRY